MMHPMIWELTQLSNPENPVKYNRGVLAVLRHGLMNGSPGEYVPMFPYMQAWLTDEECEKHFSTFCLVASLYALHPVSTSTGSLGTHMRATIIAARDSKPLEHATERRFLTLLRVHPDDLSQQLMRAIRYLASKNQGVNWQRLLEDLLRWEYDPDTVRKQWARDFWRSAKQSSNAADGAPDTNTNPDTNFDLDSDS